MALEVEKENEGLGVDLHKLEIGNSQNALTR